MTAKISVKDTILDAAEAIVLESGASHMTLDAVAERAAVSKGGLMYHFPSKEALLEAMISRLIHRFDEIRDQVRQSFAPEIPTELMVEIKMFSGFCEEAQRVGAALLAVVANQPTMIRNFCECQRERFLTRLIPPDDFEHSSILFFAALGLHFCELLKIPVLDLEHRKQIYDELLRLASETGGP